MPHWKRTLSFALLSLAFVQAPPHAFAEDVFVSMAGQTVEVSKPDVGQLANLPPTLLAFESTESVKSNDLLSTSARDLILAKMEARGAVLRKESDYPWFAAAERSKRGIVKAVLETKKTVQPVRILILGRIAHVESTRKLLINLEVFDNVTNEFLAEDQVEISYPPLASQCFSKFLGIASKADPKCLKPYAEFLAQVGESNLFKKLSRDFPSPLELLKENIVRELERGKCR